MQPQAITLQVQGMTCGHCERAVRTAIQARDPAAEVRIERARGVVQAHTVLARSALVAAIAEEGYQVSG
jgi:copper chaperone